MKFEEVILDEEVEEYFDVDEFFAYWMKITDPRYIADKEAFMFEQASGSGEWDY